MIFAWQQLRYAPSCSGRCVLRDRAPYSGALEVAEAARAAPEAPQLPRSLDLVLDGLARRCTEGPSGGVPALTLALQAVRNEALDGHA